MSLIFQILILFFTRFTNLVYSNLVLGDDLQEVSSWINTSDNYYDVVIHGNNNGEFSVLLDGINQSYTPAQLATHLSNVPQGKTIRLLSCNNYQSTRELAQILGRDIVGSSGEMKLYNNGLIQAEDWYIARGNGTLNDFTPTSSGLSTTGVFKVLKMDQVGSVVKLTNKSSLSTTLFNQLDNALSSAPPIKFNYGSKALQSPKQFLNEVGNDMYDIAFSNGGYAKFDNATGRMLYSDGTNQYFIHFETGNNVTNVEQLLNTRITQFRNYLGLNGPQTIQLTNGLGTITTSSSKATTFIGKTTETILLKNQFGNFKHYKVGESPGAVNLLNMPDTYFNGATWWIDHNRDWILRAINRGDDIYIASRLDNIDMNVDNILVSQQYGPSYYANELKALVDANYKPINLSESEWSDVKVLINSIFND